MTKSKIGAEPKGKVKHSFTKDAGIHEGIHRDEPGWCGGLKGACMAIINRERKIAVIKEGTDYSWSM